MKVSVVIPAFNAQDTLGACLSACLEQDYPDLEVIVVDDGSHDGTGGVVAGFPGVRYLRQENAGPAAARNRGARAARGEWVAFTDSDCVPEPAWLTCLMAGFDEGVAGVGGTYGIANPGSRLARLVHAEIRTRHARFGDEVDFLGSFNVAYRREVFEAAGGFDESFRMASGEDNDLAYRLHDMGYVLRFRGDAVVAHHHPTGLWPYLRTQRWHGYWRMKLYRKHPKRGGGDHYAGLADLLAAPFSVMLLIDLGGTLLLAPLVAPRWDVLAGQALLTVLYASLCLVRAARVRGANAFERLLLAGLIAARDVARGIGMVKGLWHFHMRRKESI